MSAYIKLATMEYPRHEQDIRNEYPMITEDQTGPTFPCPNTYALVQWAEPPSYLPDQYIQQGVPAQVDGVWRMTWVVKDYTPAELAAMGCAANFSPPGHDPERLKNAGSAPDVTG